MLEYYYRFFKNNYKEKILLMIKDIKSFIKLENITISDDYDLSLPKKYSEWLDENVRSELNQLYYTLYKNIDSISPSLKRFFIKDTEPKKHLLIDTFAWCWWLSLWLENAWFNPVFVNEIEKKFLETYYYNRDLPINHYYCWDIKDLIDKFEEYKEYFKDIDLFAWWPPCQWFSMANRQRVIDDPRNKLYKYYLELLKLTHPKFFIMENVKWMMNKAGEIKENFAEKVWDEYSIQIILLNAKDFWIPQNRERLIVIWSRIKNAPANRIVEEIYKQQWKYDFKLWDAIKWLPELWIRKDKNSSKIENDIVWYKIRKYKYSNTKYEQYLNKNHVEYVFNHTNRYNNPRDVEIYSKLPQWWNSLHESISDIMPYKNRNDIFKDKYYKLKADEVCKTITSHMKFDCNMYIHPYQSRWLSPREAARVQTFPDDFMFMWTNNDWYAQIWNAVPVKLAEVIWKAIFKFLD